MGPLTWIAVILFAAWVLGVLAFKVVGFAIHLLFIAALILLAVALVRSARRRRPSSP